MNRTSKTTLEVAEERLQKLQEQKKELEAKIMREQGRLREQERKARNRCLIEYGGLVELAALTEVEQGTVLGMLLDGATRIQKDDDVARQWKTAGDRLLAERAAERREASLKKRGKAQATVTSHNGVKAKPASPQRSGGG